MPNTPAITNSLVTKEPDRLTFANSRSGVIG